MNECFVIVKIISNIQFNFIINSENISIVEFDIELKNKSKIKIKGYNEVADKCYKQLRKGNTIFINGKIQQNSIEIKKIEKV